MNFKLDLKTSWIKNTEVFHLPPVIMYNLIFHDYDRILETAYKPKLMDKEHDFQIQETAIFINVVLQVTSGILNIVIEPRINY